MDCILWDFNVPFSPLLGQETLSAQYAHGAINAINFDDDYNCPVAFVPQPWCYKPIRHTAIQTICHCSNMSNAFQRALFKNTTQ